MKKPIALLVAGGARVRVRVEHWGDEFPISKLQSRIAFYQWLVDRRSDNVVAQEMLSRLTDVAKKAGVTVPNPNNNIYQRGKKK